MPLGLIDPAVLPTPESSTQVVVATGSRLVFVSWQEPEDAGDGYLIEVEAIAVVG